MIQAKVNDKTQFDLIIQDKVVSVNGKALNFDAISFADGSMHLLLGTQSYRIRIVNSDAATKAYSINVNGNNYSVGLSDEMDLLLNRLGFASQLTKKINNVKAPMPGLVLKVIAAAGDKVKKGDPLLVLEAMKMENIIKSPGEGIVKNICVSPSEKVDKNAVLLEFE